MGTQVPIETKDTEFGVWLQQGEILFTDEHHGERAADWTVREEQGDWLRQGWRVAYHSDVESSDGKNWEWIWGKKAVVIESGEME